ncbi:tripartite motif-containing protein 6-like [Discoglossus pictus]
MASIIDQIQDELTCTICFNTLNDAMTLECGHHNCCQCVQELIRQSTQNGERYAKCPQCRERIHPSKIKADNTLRNIKSIITQTNQDVLMCEKHLKRMVIFCEDDRVMICWLCGINDHRSHYLRPLQEAADSYKTKLNEFQHQFKQRIDVLNGQILVKRKAIELETSKKQPNSQKIGNAVLEEKKLQEQVDSLTDLSTVVQKKCEEELHVFLQDITDLLAR